MGPPSTPPTAFEGHGTETYDKGKKKYVGSWTDSMSTGLSTSEGTYDATSKTMTGWMVGPDMDGQCVEDEVHGHHEGPQLPRVLHVQRGP